jgi:aspartyl-tRNA(Asn)/glutamyl-tRNA(Gln) amidotransferase subunit C
MKIGPEEVRHVARLAELAVDDADVGRLAEELGRIVAFVERLQDMDAAAAEDGATVGPDRLLLRDDVVRPIAMDRGPADFAPAFEDGFFVVPKLGGLAEE